MNQELLNQLAAAGKGPVAPLVLELVLSNGKSYWVHSVIDGLSNSTVAIFRIWDFRRMAETDYEQLLRRLNDVPPRETPERPEDLHPLLTWSALHVPVDNINHFVVWHNVSWPLPEPEKPKGPIGYLKDQAKRRVRRRRQ